MFIVITIFQSSGSKNQTYLCHLNTLTHTFRLTLNYSSTSFKIPATHFRCEEQQFVIYKFDIQRTVRRDDFLTNEMR